MSIDLMSVILSRLVGLSCVLLLLTPALAAVCQTSGAMCPMVEAAHDRACHQAEATLSCCDHDVRTLEPAPPAQSIRRIEPLVPNQWVGAASELLPSGPVPDIVGRRADRLRRPPALFTLFSALLI